MNDSERERLREERRRMKDEYSDLYEMVEALLFRHDLEENTSEYELETSLLLPRLRTCRSAADVTRMVHKVFEECFGYIEARAERLYEPIGAEIWALWVAFQEPTPPTVPSA
jgi:hypothetical protein